MQRIVGSALGYEDLNDHDQIRHDPVLAGKRAATREDCAPLAGKSTLNRLELSRDEPPAMPGLLPIPPPSRLCSSICFSMPTPRLRRRSTSMPPMSRGTGARRAGSFMATTTAIVTCRSTSSAVGTCWRPNCAAPTSMARPERSRKWRASSARSVPAGRGCAFGCAPTAASAARR